MTIRTVVSFIPESCTRTSVCALSSFYFGCSATLRPRKRRLANDRPSFKSTEPDLPTDTRLRLPKGFPPAHGAWHRGVTFSSRDTFRCGRITTRMPPPNPSSKDKHEG